MSMKLQIDRLDANTAHEFIMHTKLEYASEFCFLVRALHDRILLWIKTLFHFDKVLLHSTVRAELAEPTSLRQIQVLHDL